MLRLRIHQGSVRRVAKRRSRHLGLILIGDLIDLGPGGHAQVNTDLMMTQSILRE